MNETKRLNVLVICGTIQRTVLKYMHFSEKQFYQIATPHSHTVGDGHTRSDMVEHHRRDILLENCRTQSNTVVDARTYDRTRSHKINSYRTLSHRRPYTVEHGRTKLTLTAHCRTDDHTRSNTVAHGRTKLTLTAHCRTDDHTRSNTVAQKILNCQHGLPSNFGLQVDKIPEAWVKFELQHIQSCTIQL